MQLYEVVIHAGNGIGLLSLGYCGISAIPVTNPSLKFL